MTEKNPIKLGQNAFVCSEIPLLLFFDDDGDDDGDENDNEHSGTMCIIFLLCIITLTLNL